MLSGQRGSGAHYNCNHYYGRERRCVAAVPVQCSAVQADTEVTTVIL